MAEMFGVARRGTRGRSTRHFKDGQTRKAFLNVNEKGVEAKIKNKQFPLIFLFRQYFLKNLRIVAQPFLREYFLTTISYVVSKCHRLL